MSKRKGIPLHEWQKIARVESVRDMLASEDRFAYENEHAQRAPDLYAPDLYLNKPAREALQPYLDDSRETPDAS